MIILVTNIIPAIGVSHNSHDLVIQFMLEGQPKAVHNLDGNTALKSASLKLKP